MHDCDLSFKHAFRPNIWPKMQLLTLMLSITDFTNDVVLSPTVLKAINGTLSKYRVTFKLLLGMLDGFQLKEQSFKGVQIVHQIALIQLRQLVEKTLTHFRRFEINKAVQEINRYINTDLSGRVFPQLNTYPTVHELIPGYL